MSLFPTENKEVREQEGWRWFDAMIKNSATKN